MAGVSEGIAAGYGRRVAPVTAATGHGRAALAGRNRQWAPPPGGTGG